MASKFSRVRFVAVPMGCSNSVRGSRPNGVAYCSPGMHSAGMFRCTTPCRFNMSAQGSNSVIRCITSTLTKRALSKEREAIELPSQAVAFFTMAPVSALLASASLGFTGSSTTQTSACFPVIGPPMLVL
jgi:hypothetical protein